MPSATPPEPATSATAYAPLPDPEYLTRRSIPEREARGLAMREQVPAAQHGTWEAPAHRADPIEILRRQDEQRQQDLVALRHGRMAVSPFAFFRGGAAIMAADLAGTPSCGLRVQLCGDAHLLNFGVFETPERTLVFGINDFDETLPGPVEWDLKRLVASVELAARDLELTATQRAKAVRATVRGYREALREFADMGNLQLWYSRYPAVELLRELEACGDARTTKEAQRRAKQAMRRDHLHAFGRLVDVETPPPHFKSDPPLLIPVEELLEGDERARYLEVLQSFLTQYRESLQPDRRRLVELYRYAHMARKVVGVGSVGTRAWVVLFIGTHGDDDPLILQLKEAQPSVLAPYAGDTHYPSEGRRVVEGQRLMQTASDPLLGWYSLVAFDGVRRDFYVRQLWDGKASIDVSRLSSKGLRTYARRCGWTLARGHARSGDRIALAEYFDDAAFDDALADFAVAYADQTEHDHARLVAAINAGELAAELA